MLIGGLVGVVVVLGVVAAVVVRQRTYDDVHSVEHYHRQLHTLEEMRAHAPTAGGENGTGENGTGENGTGENGTGENGTGEAAYPASAFRVSGSSTVRLTQADRPVVPPAPPPPVANPSEPVTFDDAGADGGAPPGGFMSGTEDPVIHSINHRPRRLGGPAAAVAAVTVLIVVLIVTGLHTNSPNHHGRSGTATTTAGTHPRPTSRHSNATTTTTTTAPLTVSAPASTSAYAATYQVADASYSLSLAATTGECWVEAKDTATGSVLFTATLFSGQSHTITASGAVTVIAGAPAAFSATVDGSTVSLPSGYQAPFTLSFTTAQTA